MTINIGNTSTPATAGQIAQIKSDLGLGSAADRAATDFTAFVGAFSTAAALQAGKPAASNAGADALVGSAPPYTAYRSDGAAWVSAVSGAGVSAVDVSAGSATLTADQITALRVVLGGTLAADTTITAPVGTGRRWWENRTAGAFTLRVVVGAKNVRIPRHDVIEIA